MNKYTFLSLLVMCVTLQGKKIETDFNFIDTRFDDFVTRLVPQEDHQSFSFFYQNFLENQKENKFRKNYLSQLRTNAHCSLSVKHPLWAKSLEPYIGHVFKRKRTDDMSEIRTFLVRYGVYEEFLKQKALRHASVWTKMKSIGRNMKMKVAGWFSFGKYRTA